MANTLRSGGAVQSNTSMRDQDRPIPQRAIELVNQILQGLLTQDKQVLLWGTAPGSLVLQSLNPLGNPVLQSPIHLESSTSIHDTSL